MSIQCLSCRFFLSSEKVLLLGSIRMMPLVSFIFLQPSYQWTISLDVSNFLTGEASNIWIDLLALLLMLLELSLQTIFNFAFPFSRLDS